MSGQQLGVIATGAVTAVGLSSAQTCAAIRSGISAVAQSDFVLQTADWERVLAASVPMRPRASACRPAARLCALARLALQECFAALADGGHAAGADARRIALLVGVPEPARLERFDRWFGQDVRQVLLQQLLGPFHPSSEILPHGNVSAFVGLHKARELIAAGVVEACIVGGVDSLLNSADLDALEGGWRLHREGEGNGLVPGEAAAFVAVTRRDAANGTRPLATIAGLGIDREPAETAQAQGGHPTGQGMVRALKAATADAGVAESVVGLRVTDLNGERYRAMDSMLTVSRFYRTDRDGLPICHPAECIGETGAAVGAVLIQVACQGIVRGYAPVSAVMCETSCHDGLRGTCLVLA